jgi:hypothetical protein
MTVFCPGRAPRGAKGAGVTEADDGKAGAAFAFAGPPADARTATTAVEPGVEASTSGALPALRGVAAAAAAAAEPAAAAAPPLERRRVRAGAIRKRGG